MTRPCLATDSPPALDEMRRAAALGALCRERFGLVARTDTSAAFGVERTTAPGDLGYLPGIYEFSTGWVVTDCQTATADPPSRIEDRIGAALRHDEIIDALMALGPRSIANRLRYLHDLAEDDDDEPAMVLASLRKLALFLASEQCPVAPEIGLSPDGLLQVQWRLEGGGLSAMKFLPDDLIQFAAVSGRAPGEGRRRRVHGLLPKDEALAAVRRFLPTEGASS